MTEYTYEMLDKMTAEELERIVDEDAAKPVKEQMDDNMMLYILSLLDRKGNYGECFTDTEKARRTFIEVYYENPEERQKNTADKKKKRRENFRFSPKIMRIACVVVLALFAVSMVGRVNEASGQGLENSFYNWTDEKFWFDGVDEWKQGVFVAGDFDNITELYRIQMMLIRHNNLEDVMVTYLPENCLVNGYIAEGGQAAFRIAIEIRDENNPKTKIILSYHDVLFGGDEYEKDPGQPELYKVGGITHYIMTNDGKWQALWKNGMVECSISGVEKKSELLKMIDSIYEKYVPET